MGDLFGPSQAGVTTTTQTQEPWDEQKPYLEYGFDQALDLLQAPGPLYFPGSTVAGPGEITDTARAAQIGRAMDGSPVDDAAREQLTGTLQGDYLNNNPFLGDMLDMTFERIRPQIDEQFGGNNYGGSAHIGAMTSAYGNAGTQLGYQNYNDERQRQMGAVGMAPQISGLDYRDISALSEVGALEDQFAQSQLTDSVNRWNFEQQRPANKLAQYSQLVQGNYGGTGTTTQPYYTNPAASILGATAAAGSMAAKASDRRVKENISRIGTADNGFPLYRFNYIGDPKVEIGVMAQDVEQIIPEAVIEIDGVKHVEYGRVFPLRAA